MKFCCHQAICCPHVIFDLYMSSLGMAGETENRLQCAISRLLRILATVVLESIHRFVIENFAMVTALGASCKAVLMLPMILCVARRPHQRQWCKTASGDILVKGGTKLFDATDISVNKKLQKYVQNKYCNPLA